MLRKEGEGRKEENESGETEEEEELSVKVRNGLGERGKGEESTGWGHHATLFHQPCGGAGGCSHRCCGRSDRGWSGGLPAAHC